MKIGEISEKVQKYLITLIGEGLHRFKMYGELRA